MLPQQANAFAAAPWGGFQPQNLPQQQPTQVVAPAMDESTGSGALLMASMAGGAFGLQPQPQQEGSIHLNPSSRRGSSALQNMQAVLLQQQRAPQQQQQSNRMAGNDHFLSSSNLTAKIRSSRKISSNMISAMVRPRTTPRRYCRSSSFAPITRRLRSAWLQSPPPGGRQLPPYPPMRSLYPLSYGAPVRFQPPLRHYGS